MKQEGAHLVAEEKQTLWLLTFSPAIWTVYFIVSYIAGALRCGMAAEPGEGLGAIRLAMAALGVVALAGIGLVGRAGWRKHTYGEGESPHDEDTPEDRHRFLGFATVLLSALSAIATIYVALVPVFIGGCT